MSVSKRELKTIEELQTWIDGSRGAAESPCVIVRQPPKSGAPDWTVVAIGGQHGVQPRWSPHRRHAIRRAQLLFDLR
jgi:hypothetical protein